MTLKCLITRTHGGLLLQPTADNLTAQSTIAMPPRFVPENEDAEHVPYATLEAHVGQVVGLDLMAGVVTLFTKKKKK